MADQTLSFYRTNAERYAANEGKANPRIFSFLDRCKPNGRVLELGTGGGVDAAAIIGRGFDLDATDGSPELAAIAASRIGRPVRTMLFNELEAMALRDGYPQFGRNTDTLGSSHYPTLLYHFRKYSIS